MGSLYDATANAMQHARIAEFWYKRDPESDPATLVYCASILIDCSINFRSLKAGMNESEERTYTAWLRPGSLAVDWDFAAIDPIVESRLDTAPDEEVRQLEHRPELDEERWSEIESELVDRLTRREKLVLHYNPLFEIFSGVRESLADFLDRAAEVALQNIEPELKQLKHVYELQLEQVREAHINRRGALLAEESASGAPTSKLEIERLLRGRTEFSETENRVTSLFTGLAGLVLQVPNARDDEDDVEIEDGPAQDLRDDLGRVEREAADALNELYTKYLEMVRSYDDFVVGIQPANIRIVRRALVWVPVTDESRRSV
jgi:hypothetical protein